MKLSMFVSTMKNVMGENRLLKFALVVMLVIVIQMAQTTKRALGSRVTVVMPPTITEPVTIAQGKVSDSYVRDFSRYIASLMFTYTHATVREQFGDLLTLYAPEAYPEAKKYLNEIATTIEQTKATSIFSLQKIVLDQKNQTIEISGAQRLFVEDRLADTLQKTYFIEYRISEKNEEMGRFYVLKISEKG